MSVSVISDSRTFDSQLMRLPFDQYGRYKMIQEALDAARVAIGHPLQILDVGGYHRMLRGDEVLPARLFLPNDDVTVLDQIECALPGYMRGDGRGLDFANDAFDFVISCDTLEHVPAPDRPAFWQELLRVARYGVVLAAPFASPEVVAAEELLCSYIQVELGTEQRQLKEHRDYGLPAIELTKTLLDELGLRHRVYPSGYVHAWLAMMIAKHYLLPRTNDYDLHERLDTYYTQFLSADERCEPSYRHVWLVECAAQGGWWQSACAALEPTICERCETEAPGWEHIAQWWLQLANLQLADKRIEPLTQALAAYSQQLTHLQQVVAQREAHIADLEARARWLEQQSRDARHALESVEHGFVLRLLRTLTRGRKAKRV
ncbi:MAG: hypothetical protein GFH27_549313n6 [Chloroflexi bacterium AL-W]|nr:hypothetical protein [Chloroflexi bacterium AL-N1]NOK69429.1 hypothetical protein [Chloroflexi bacterium AL-N10]NOK77394.1 hypothetical protein [Chloroflexi bacterium AL-N5]NOK84245.1 hypothetical protein [Chloroflexi bacterium AL-W]NOK91590.1 hypothetical protein [Chloroflexi bacterium AL-N15]